MGDLRSCKQNPPQEQPMSSSQQKMHLPGVFLHLKQKDPWKCVKSAKPAYLPNSIWQRVLCLPFHFQVLHAFLSSSGIALCGQIFSSKDQPKSNEEEPELDNCCAKENSRIARIKADNFGRSPQQTKGGDQTKNAKPIGKSLLTQVSN
ncbi:hypothetical protein FGO68_gene15174 [Halteria grandinella]|uniref:Uncharacterized protein n=1 Tax=Halteria grandinella TaxID=5974 RepID=A0A8J8STP2_HALGN|nr:hypothetical protein FGO68_gene15174 [Halteria grandinella]